MKKYLLLCTALVVASSAYALDCATPPTCAQLGFTMSADECAGKFTLKCPFDNTNVFCGMNINDGTACQTAIADTVTVTGVGTELDLTNIKYLYPETVPSCSTSTVILGAGSSLNSYCAFSACYCSARPGYCDSSIILKDSTSVNGIELQGVQTLSLQGSVTFNNTTTSSAIDNTMITASANGKYIYIGPGSSIATTTLTPITSTTAYTYNINVQAKSSLTVTNMGVGASYNALTHKQAAVVVRLTSSSSVFTFGGTKYIGDGTPDTCTALTSGVNSATISVCK